MYSVRIDGFATLDHAKQFLSWYGEQGEQDIEIWLAEFNLPSTNLHHETKVEGNTVIGRIA